MTIEVRLRDWIQNLSVRSGFPRYMWQSDDYRFLVRETGKKCRIIFFSLFWFLRNLSNVCSFIIVPFCHLCDKIITIISDLWFEDVKFILWCAALINVQPLINVQRGIWTIESERAASLINMQHGFFIFCYIISAFSYFFNKACADWKLNIK